MRHRRDAGHSILISDGGCNLRATAEINVGSYTSIGWRSEFERATLVSYKFGRVSRVRVLHGVLHGVLHCYMF